MQQQEGRGLTIRGFMMVELGMSLIALFAFVSMGAAIYGLVGRNVNSFMLGVFTNVMALGAAVNGGAANELTYYKLLAAWGMASVTPVLLILVFAAFFWEKVQTLLK